MWDLNGFDGIWLSNVEYEVHKEYVSWVCPKIGMPLRWHQIISLLRYPIVG